jgi:hypothetical protein
LQHLEDLGNATKPSQGGNKRVTLLEERREKEHTREHIGFDGREE